MISEELRVCARELSVELNRVKLELEAQTKAVQKAVNEIARLYHCYSQNKDSTTLYLKYVLDELFKAGFQECSAVKTETIIESLNYIIKNPCDSRNTEFVVNWCQKAIDRLKEQCDEGD